MLLLEKDTTKKERVDKKVTGLEIEASNNEEFKIEVIWDSAIYINKAKSHLSSLYYLIA